MSAIPDLPGVLSRDQVIASGEHLASLQTTSGMIPWFPGGHCDPWNHVESAMALDVAGFHAEAERAYEWLADIQRRDASWHNYYVPDGHRVERRSGSGTLARLGALAFGQDYVSTAAVVLILAGGGTRGHEAALRALAERLDAPVVQTINARGQIHDCPGELAYFLAVRHLPRPLPPPRRPRACCGCR